MVLDCLVVLWTIDFRHDFQSLLLHRRTYLIVLPWFYTLNAMPQLRTIVRAQGVLTQLIFDHALRIRVQGDVKEDSLTQESPASEHPSPEGSSNARGGSSSDVDEETVASSTSFDAKADDQSSETPKQESKPNTANLAGRLNNLVTSDMSNVHGGQGFMLLSMFYRCCMSGQT